MPIFTFPIVGLPHAGAAFLQQHAAILLAAGTAITHLPLLLVPEPTNPHDPNAIRVLVDPRALVATPPFLPGRRRKPPQILAIPSPFAIGYVRKDKAAKLAPFLAGTPIQVRLDLGADDIAPGRADIPVNVWCGLIKSPIALPLPTVRPGLAAASGFLPPVSPQASQQASGQGAAPLSSSRQPPATPRRRRRALVNVWI